MLFKKVLIFEKEKIKNQPCVDKMKFLFCLMNKILFKIKEIKYITSR